MKKEILGIAAFAAALTWTACESKPKGLELQEASDTENVVEAEVQTKDNDDDTIREFLTSIYTPEGVNMIFDEEWIFEHCSKKMQKILRDEYEYDGEGWGSWLIGGWGAGEDVSTELAGIMKKGDCYYVTLVPTAEVQELVSGKRVIRFSVSVKNGTPVIDECEWTEDAFEWNEM